MTSHGQQHSGALTILNVGTGNHDREQEPSHINQDMALATLDPFGPIEAFGAASIGHLHRL